MPSCPVACEGLLTGPHHSGIRVLSMHHIRQRGAPMQALQNRDLLSSEAPVMDQLQAFLRQRRAAHKPVEDLDAFAQHLHRLFVVTERKALGQELSASISMCRQSRWKGSVTIASCDVRQPLPVRWDLCGSSGACIGAPRVVTRCARWELRAGIIEGSWTP